MKLKLLTCLFLILVCGHLTAQRVYLLPSHFHGIYSDQLSSARAQGMGYTTITQDGITTSLYNPATISPGNTIVNLGLNYAKGSPQFPKSYYPFAGLSYRVLPKLTLGASMFAWIDPDSYWNAVIANQVIETDKKTQHLYSIMAAYQIINGLHFGVSGNFLRASAVRGTTTAKDFILNTGLIYDRDANLLKQPRVTNQRIRLAASLANTLMKPISNETYKNLLNYRDLPIILRGGAAYSFSIPVSASFAKRSRFFREEPEILDLALRVQYQNWLKHKEHIFNDNKFSTAFGIGAEAWFMKLLAFRLGYYHETRPEGSNRNEIVVTDPKKRGITWGLGANLPVQRLSGGKIPVDIELNLVTQRMMNEMKDEYTAGSDLRDKRFQFCLQLDVKWNGKKTSK